MNNSFSILINTCDKFEDCWDPFFKLWAIYWPEYKGTIFLNTEYKDYSYPGLNIVSLKVCEKNKVSQKQRATWSQCLKWALESIDSDIVLYMQEDYFLTDRVKNESIEYFGELMYKTPEIPCIQLTHAGIPALRKSQYDFLYTSDSDFFSYVSCQASFWRKNVMLSLIREHETAWNFEWWGSKRAKHLGYQFLVVDPQIFSPEKNLIFPYILTGVIGGKWYRPVVELFEKHNIKMDYSIRGFYIENKKPDIRKRIRTKISIWRLKSIFEVMKMKFLYVVNSNKHDILYGII